MYLSPQYRGFQFKNEQRNEILPNSPVPYMCCCKKHIWLPLTCKDTLTEKRQQRAFQIGYFINMQQERNKPWPFLIKQPSLSSCVQRAVAQMAHMEFDRNNLISLIKDLKGSSCVSSVPSPGTLSRYTVVVPHTAAIKKGGAGGWRARKTWNQLYSYKGQTAYPYSPFPPTRFYKTSMISFSPQDGF